ncbi:MAG: oligosaccharide flippase family protein [Candidatus Cloacimonetes bacterium]|nr:oligosaccharide flippase family protein [Bacteroidota bacterium]MBL7085960.1 oligosaccharide flippase family protein [Candidatus Cloacimonadota bacterium]
MKKLKYIFKKKEHKVLIENFTSLSLLQIVNYVLPLIVLPYLIRVLGVEKFGLVMFAQAFIMFFNIIVDYGFNLSATRDISINRDNKEKITEIFSSVIIIKLALIIISFILLSVIVFSFEKFFSDWKLYYLTFLWVIGQALFPIWYFQGMERMKYITFVNITSKVIFTLLIFIVIQNENDYIYVPLLNGLGFMIGGIISLWIIHKNFNQKFKPCSYNVLKQYFVDSSQFFLSRVSVSIYTSSNVFVLGLFTNNIMVGYYSIAEKLYRALQQIYHPIVQALYPHVAKQRNIKLFKKIFSIVTILNILGVILLFFIGEYIFNILFTTSIGGESLGVFHILLMVSLIVVPSMLLGYPFLAALGFPKYANMSVIIGSVFHLIGLSVLAILDYITIYSVAFVVLGTEILVLSSRVYWIRSNKLWIKL